MNATFTNLDAEQIVAAFLCQPESGKVERIRESFPDLVSDWLPTLGPVWSAASALADQGKEVHFHSIKDALVRTGQFERVGKLEGLPVEDQAWSVACYQLEKLRDLHGNRAVAEIAADLGKGMSPREAIALLEPLAETQSRKVDSIFTDLSQYLDGVVEVERPTVAETFNGHHLFYARRLNEIHAEPSAGKTNIILAAAISVMEAGGIILFLDPEDNAPGIVTRLRLLGASPDDIRENFRYVHNPEPQDIITAQAWARKNKPQMVCLDGLAEGLTTAGADENCAGDVLRYFRECVRPFADAGAAVVIADHVTKSAEGRGQFARGSGAKAGRYDGVSYEVQTGKAYSPQLEGFVRLKVAKDRNGGVGPRGTIAAELHFIPGADGCTITAFREPADKQEGPFRPTVLMDKILARLGVVGEETKTALRGLGKNEWVDEAIVILKKEGKIDLRKEGCKHLYYLTNKEEA